VTTLVLIGCTAKKLARAAPARELYQGRLFAASVQYAEARGLPWLVLSALHGVVGPDDVLEPYDVTLAGLSSADRETWGSVVAVTLRRLGATRVIVLAGREYVRPWRDAVAEIAVEEPLLGRGVGARFAWLKAHRMEARP